MINYDLQKIKAIVLDVDGVLSSPLVYLHEGVEPIRTANIKDGYALQLAVKQGLILAIITGGASPAVRLRYERLGIKDIYMKTSVKIKAYEELLEKYDLRDEEILYMGDDIPDMEVMKRCGCACCPKDAAYDVKNISLYISNSKGGEGCVRDVVEQVLRAKGLWLNDAKAFGW